MPAWWWGTMTSKLGAILYCHIAYQQIERSIVVVVRHKHSIQNRHRNQAKGTTIFWCTEVTRHKLHSICLRVNPSESVTILLRCVDLNPPNTAWAWCHHSCETNHFVNQALRCQSIGLGIVFDEYNTCTYMQNGNLQKKIVFQSNTMHTAHCEFHSVTLTSIIHHSLCIVRWAHLMRLTSFLRAVDTHSFGGFSSTSLWTSASVLSSKALSDSVTCLAQVNLPGVGLQFVTLFAEECSADNTGTQDWLRRQSRGQLLLIMCTHAPPHACISLSLK